VRPTINLTIFENSTQQFLTGAIISLLKDNLYIFTCSANSNPGVSLSLFDTNTKKVLSMQNNTIASLYCNTNGIGCSANIYVSLDIVKNQFDNMTSVTCEAKSLNSNISLSANLSQSLFVQSKSIY